jgi:hypothetical protein
MYAWGFGVDLASAEYGLEQRQYRLARVGDVALLEKLADSRSPKRIDCYQVTEHSAGGAAVLGRAASIISTVALSHSSACCKASISPK